MKKDVPGFGYIHLTVLPSASLQNINGQHINQTDFMVIPYHLQETWCVMDRKTNLNRRVCVCMCLRLIATSKYVLIFICAFKTTETK